MADADTTSGQIACSLLTLLAQPRLMVDVRADATLAPAIPDETIRLEPGIAIAPRTLIEPVEIGGIERPAGARVWLSTMAANSDPDVWSGPDTFEPRRFTSPEAPKLLTFGGGPHACLGTWLARLTLEEAVRGVAGLGAILTVAPVDIQWVQLPGVNPELLPVTIG